MKNKTHKFKVGDIVQWRPQYRGNGGYDNGKMIVLFYDPGLSQYCIVHVYDFTKNNTIKRLYEHDLELLEGNAVEKE